VAFPAVDLLKALVAQVESQAKMQHKDPAYIAAETKRLVDYQDTVDTARQLANYGVTLE
jgi:hypothetical protein